MENLLRAIKRKLPLDTEVDADRSAVNTPSSSKLFFETLLPLTPRLRDTKHIDLVNRDPMLRMDITHLHTCVFRLLDVNEHSKPQYLSIFGLAFISQNVSDSTKSSLRLLYKESETLKYLSMYVKTRAIKALSLIGVNVNSSSGSAFVVSCVVHGNLLTKTYPTKRVSAVSVPKDMFLDLSGPHEGGGVLFFLNLITEGGNNSFFFIRTRTSDISYVTTAILSVFIKERLSYLDAWVEGRLDYEPFGNLTRIGFISGQCVATSVAVGAIELSVYKVTDLFIDISDNIQFM